MIIKSDNNLDTIIVENLNVKNTKIIDDESISQNDYMKDLLDKAHLSLLKSKYGNDYKNDINNYNYMLISSELKLSDGSVINIDSMAIKDKHTGEIIASGSPSLNPELNSTMSIDKTENIKDFLNNPLEEYEFLQEKYRYKKDEKDLESLKLIDNSSSLLQEYSDIKNKHRNNISYFNLSDFINIKLNNSREFSIDKNKNHEPLVTDVIDIKGMEFGNSNDYKPIVNISNLSVISNKNLTQNDLDTHFLRDELLASLQESILKNKNNGVILDNLQDFEYSLVSGFSKFENPLNNQSFDVGILSLALKETKTGKTVLVGNPVIDEESLLSISQNPEKYGANKSNSFDFITKVKKTFNNPTEDYDFNLESFKHNEKQMNQEEKNTFKKIFETIESSSFFKEFNSLKNLHKNSITYFNISDYLKNKIQEKIIPNLKSIKDTFIQFNSQNEVKEKNENKYKM